MLKNIISIFVALVSSTAFGWGNVGHQIVAYVGGNSAVEGQAFWQSNLEPLRKLTTVPDRVWKSASTKKLEAHHHWFQADFYYQPTEYTQITRFPQSYSDSVARYTEDVVIENGTAPWRIRQLYQMAVQALKAGDTQSALQYVGTMSHYIGDLAQPLHISENYDGQLTGNSGIHAYFETKVITNEMTTRKDVQARVQKLLVDTQFLSQFKGTLMDTLLREIQRSIAFRDTILSNDNKYHRTAQGAAIQLELAKSRMADGAATFALILNRLWKEAGVNIMATPMNVPDPAWIETDFGQLQNKSIAHEGDDCSQ